MSNKKLGNDFENYIAQYLFSNGFWVLRILDGWAGQPVDIIAVKNQKASLIECKVCSKNSFNTGRIEPNQHTTFQLWRESGNGEGYIAIKFGRDIYLVTYKDICGLDKKSISREIIASKGIRLEEWIKREDNY